MSMVPDDASDSVSPLVNNWLRSPYGIKLSEDPAKAFTTLIESIRFSLAEDAEIGEVSDNVFNYLKILEDDQLSNGGGDNANQLADGAVFYSKPNYTDTRVGGNDAVNPYWQFCRDDDIVPPNLYMSTLGKSGPGKTEGGMGRVYSEVYDANQRILWMCMGVPEFNNLVSFYMDSGNKNAAAAMNKGTLRGLAGQLIDIVWHAGIWAITFPVTAPFYLRKWLRRTQTERITKYYYFKPAMVLYYEMVNSMMSYVAVSMGVYPQYVKKRKDSTKELEAAYDLNGGSDATTTTTTNEDGTTEEVVSNPIEIIASAESSAIVGKDPSQTGIPEILRNGLDIFAILNRRAAIFDVGRTQITTRMLAKRLLETDQSGVDSSGYFLEPDVMYDKDPATGEYIEAVDPVDAADSKSWAKFWASLKSNIFGAGDFIGFKIEKGVNTSETITNQTGPTGLASKLNAIAKQKKDEFESAGNTNMGRILNSVMDANVSSTLQSMLGQAVANVASVVGIGDIGAVMSAGNGFLDIPDVWQDSSFKRSYSFNVQLRARYGDPVSVFQSIMIPTLMLFAAAAPRSVGDNMYTSPFVIKAFCKGMFSIPCGIITNLVIKRGKDRFGYNNTHLPTSIDLTFDIQDLSPALFVSMQDIGLFDTFTRNDNLLEYLDTLSALGMSERLYFWPKAMRKLSAAIAIKKNTIFSSDYWAINLGRGTFQRAFAAVTPFANHEQSDIKFNAKE